MTKSTDPDPIFEGGILQPFGDGYDSTRDRTASSATARMRGFQTNFGYGAAMDLGNHLNKDALSAAISIAVAQIWKPISRWVCPKNTASTGGAFIFDVGFGLGPWITPHGTGLGRWMTVSSLRSVVGLSVLWKTPIGRCGLDFSNPLR